MTIEVDKIMPIIQLDFSFIMWMFLEMSDQNLKDIDRQKDNCKDITLIHDPRQMKLLKYNHFGMATFR